MCAIVFLAAAVMAQAEVWDATAQFSNTSNTSADLWQYAGVQDSLNGPYTLATWVAGDDAWERNGAAIGFLGNPTLFICPGSGANAGAIGWRAPYAATVDIKYTLADISPRSGNDGAGAYLYKFGGATALDYVALSEGATYTCARTGVAMNAGDMLWLQVVSNGQAANDDIRITDFTITSVPEPASLVLLGCGLMGLLAYAWRKRR